MMGFELEIKDFLEYIASEKGLSQHTVIAYSHDIQTFAKFLESSYFSTFTDVTQDQIVQFLAHLKSTNYASSSLCRKLIALKVLFRFLKREGYVVDNATLFLDTPKLWQLIPEVLTYRELENLLEQPNIQTSLGARDRAILEVLYASGLRVSELCSLCLYSIDNQFVRVIGKGSKERLVPIGSKAIEAIDHYLGKFRHQEESDRDQKLFLTRAGKPMDRISVWRMIKRYAKQAKIPKNITPHTFRHSFATHLLDNGADLRVIQELLGHANINSTDRYTHISKSHLQSAFENFHPRF